MDEFVSHGSRHQEGNQRCDAQVKVAQVTVALVTVALVTVALVTVALCVVRIAFSEFSAFLRS